MALITPQDLQLFQERQTEYRASFKGDFVTLITVETNVFSNLTVPVYAEQKRPLITPETSEGLPEAIDFELVQVGTHQTRNLKVINPSTEVMTFSLFLASSQAYDDLLAYEQPDAQTPSIVNDSDQFFRLFCNGKVDAEYLIDSTELIISPRQDQRTLCSSVHALLSDPPSESEEFELFKKRLEIYFKDAYIKQLTLQSQLNDKKDVVFFDNTIQTITNKINQLTRARPLEPQLLELLKANYQMQQDFLSRSETFVSNLPDLNTVIDTFTTILKAVLIGRHASPRFNQTTVKPKKEHKAPRSRSFHLRNEILNDVIVNNDTSKLYPDQI